MTSIPDVNVLLALAFEDHEHYPQARDWYDRVIGRGEPVGLPGVVVVGFVRNATRPSSRVNTLTSLEAFAWLDGFREAMHLLSWVDHPETESKLRELMIASGTRGNATSDAYIAALAAAYGATVVTFDRDFKRFDGVKLELLPLA